MLAKITAKGQVTLPKKIRDHLHVKPGDQLDFYVGENGVVSITPAILSVKDLKGFLPKPEKPVALKDIDRVTCKRGGE